MKTKTLNWLNSLITDTTTKAEIDIIEYAKKCVREFTTEPKNQENEIYIKELFEKFYKVYCRKGARQQAYKTFRKKLVKLKTKETILDKARKIAMLYQSQKEELEYRDESFRPLCSSWLNSNVPD